jgi:hypothetical protein
MWFFSVDVAVFTSCHFFWSCLSPKDHRHWPLKGAYIVHRRYSRNCVTCWPSCLRSVSASLKKKWQKFVRLPYPVFPCSKKKKFNSPDCDVTRLKYPFFCLFNLISVCRVNLRCLEGGGGGIMTSRILGTQKGEIAEGCNKCHEELHGLLSSL